MSEDSQSPVTSGDHQAAPTTTVVGYPEAATPASTPDPTVPSLRSQVRVVRTLVLACLVIILVVAAGVAVGLLQSQAQLADLSEQVTSLSQQLEKARTEAAAAATSAPQAAEGQGAAQEPGQAESVTQLGAAPALPEGTVIPSGVDATGAFLIGDPAATRLVELYIDYQCPFCQRWEQEFGGDLMAKALEPGSGILIKQHNLAFLGETSATLQPAGASARAASAAACVLESDGPEVFARFNAALFATADPKEPPGQFTAKVLTALAADSGASAGSLSCIKSETHVPFVAATTQAGFGRGVGGTPTVIIDGRTLGNPFTDPAVPELLTAG